ncbi:hypothetical protein [Rhizobium terrae]
MYGGFDLTELTSVDPHVGEDIATIFTFLVRERDVVYPTDYHSEIGTDHRPLAPAGQGGGFVGRRHQTVSVRRRAPCRRA